MPIDISTVAVSAMSAIVGGSVVAFLNHHFAVRRDALRRLDELKVQRRIDAWKSLEKAARIDTTGYSAETEERLKDGFDYAFAEIMLLGTSKEVELAKRLADEVSLTGDSRGLTDLLNELRASLRAELSLEPVPPAEFYFRLGRRKADDKAS